MLGKSRDTHESSLNETRNSITTLFIPPPRLASTWTDCGPNRATSQLPVDSCILQDVSYDLERKAVSSIPVIGNLLSSAPRRRKQPKCTYTTVPKSYHVQRNTSPKYLVPFGELHHPSNQETPALSTDLKSAFPDNQSSHQQCACSHRKTNADTKLGE